MAERLMKRGVYAVATNVVSAMGMNTAANWQAVARGASGVRRHEDASLSNVPFMASKPGADQWQVIYEQTKRNESLTPFERLAFYSVKDAIGNCEIDLGVKETAFILSTTKGNIELLDEVADEKLLLVYSANAVAKALGLSTKPIVISHACVSGVIALNYGLRLIDSGRYKNVIVTGCDRFSRFVLSGFQSFQAISDEACRPFDADRKGINLGEAAATIILSSQAGQMPTARLLSGATSNDANHISGPSRTGEELALAIGRALNEAQVDAKDIDMVSAHGTATLYNDEMEAKAFGIAGLTGSEVHSFKGYTGHTLGAAGVVESAMVAEAIKRQMLIPSLGYSNNGVSQELKVTQKMRTAEINYVLKTASGFGGCNAAIVWGRV
ncbi:MAG: beta-ketoacyl synthase [Bacteroidetes bacterium]|nr:beta-ketoacyl synthase [Bacteroidota bacterium]